MRRWWPLACALPLAWSAPAAGQSLDRVDELTRAGAVAEAREELLAWWAGPGERAPRDQRQRGIWLRGVLTLDASQARLDYTRLVVEYPGGAFTDQALLRLAGMARAAGDLAAARRHYEVLARDYPSSSARTEALAWLEAHPASGASAAPAGAAAAPTGGFSVQLGAFSERARADELAARLREAGFEPRIVVVEGSELVRVRAGRFPDAQGATRAYDRARAAGFDAMVVTDAARERPAGG